MSFLTDELIDTVRHEKYKFRVFPAFDVVLEIQRLYREPDLESILKTDQALKMLVLNPRKLSFLNVVERSQLLELIYRDCINTKQRPQTKPSAVPLLDFGEDGEYIYASFMLDYGIDLIDMQGQLHWKKFIALFQGLSERTKIREVMRIRGMEIPPYNGKNQKQIQELRELKSYYALPVHGGGGQQGLDALFSALEAQAVRDG